MCTNKCTELLFLPSILFSCHYFYIILHFPSFCNPLKHFIFLIFTFHLYNFPVPSQLSVVHNLCCFHVHLYLCTFPYLFTLKSPYPRSRICPNLTHAAISIPWLRWRACFTCPVQLTSQMFIPSDCFFCEATVSAPFWCNTLRNTRTASEYLLVSMQKKPFWIFLLLHQMSVLICVNQCRKPKKDSMQHLLQKSVFVLILIRVHKTYEKNSLSLQ